MKVVIHFDFDDGERALVTRYLRAAGRKKGIPKLARRRDIRDFITTALNTEWFRLVYTLAEAEAAAGRRGGGGR